MYSAVNDPGFISMLDKYSAGEDANNKLGQTLLSIYENSKNAEMVVPVLGMQGMGKSTLINAILGENILPNDADETTCVPVEVKYGEDEAAFVHFRKDDKILKVYTRDDLNSYVDNNENPANEKQVSHIVLFRKNELLRNGLTIVDLPGVGSLTRENEETTKRYIQNLCTAIFVIPTVPTIRKQEAMFIKLVWSQFTRAVFVQNVWGESEREIQESVEYNSMRLKQIADSINNTEYNGEIVVLNAYDALAGALQNNSSMVKSSNIKELISKIKDISDNWTSDLSKSITLRSLSFLHAAENELNQRIAKVNMEKSDYLAAVKKEYELYKSGTEKIKKQVNETKQYLSEQENEISSYIEESAKKCAGQIRKEMYHLIEGNVFDGDEFSKAFEETQKDECSDFSNICFDRFMDLRFNLEQKMEELRDTISEENNMRFEIYSVNRDCSFKFEKSFAPAFSVLAGVVGTAWGIAAGNGLTAVLTGVGSLAGPIGTAAGLLIGIGLTALGGLVGGKAAQCVRSKRAREARKAIDPEIDKIEKEITETANKGLKAMCTQVSDTLDQILDARKAEEASLYSKTQEEYREASYDINELETDKAKLQKWEAELTNV